MINTNIVVHDGKERCIAICMGRSPELIIAILAVLKTGTSYVPIDPVYPKKRQRYMIEDSEAIVLLADRFVGLPSQYVQVKHFALIPMLVKRTK